MSPDWLVRQVGPETAHMTTVAACGVTFEVVLIDTTENRIELAYEPSSKKD